MGKRKLVTDYLLLTFYQSRFWRQSRGRKKSSEDVKITHNNVMLNMEPSLISYFRSMGVEELNRKKETEDTEFDVGRADVGRTMDDMRARVLTGMI